MRVVYAAVLALLSVSAVRAAGSSAPVTALQLGPGKSSPAVRSLPSADRRPVISHKLRQASEPGRPPLEVRNHFVDRGDPAASPDADAALWTASRASGPEAPAALALGAVQFEGLSNADNQAILGGIVTPPDTNHDVGPGHVVETTNLLVQIFDKSGASLAGPFRMSALFGALGEPCSTHDDGDPIVLYDPLADRWLLSQFTYEGHARNRMCIAISKTPDPTGDYWVYELESPTNSFQDYPHYGVWPDGYYLTTNVFNTAGTAFQGAMTFALEREAMLVGGAADAVFVNLGQLDGSIFGMLPADLDGSLPPPPGAPNVLAYYTATEFGDEEDALRLFDFHVDWNDPEASSFVERSESPVSVAAFNPLTPSGRRDILQKSVAPGTASCTNAVDSIADRLMHRLQYRRLCDGSERLVVNHTVNANGVTVCSTSDSTYRAGVRVYELRRTTGSANPFAVVNQATYAPGGASGPSRWMGSAALDHEGNLAVGYSAASFTLSPGVRATGRLAGDPPNSLPQGEITLVAGSGMIVDRSAPSSPANRWGDYSMLAVDPADECTFWYSQEYVSAASQDDSFWGWTTRIGTFRFGGCEDLLFCTDFEAGSTEDWTDSTVP